MRTLFALGLLIGNSVDLESAEKTRPGRFRIGPVYLTPSIELKNAGVDTNVYNTPTNPIEDTSIALSPTLKAALPIGQRLRLTGTGSLDFTYFRSNDSETSLDYTTVGRAEIDVSRLTLFAGTGASRARQRFSIEIDERILRHESSSVLGCQVKLTRKISASVSQGHQTFRFEQAFLGDSDVRDLYDHDTDINKVEGNYALTDQTTAVVSAEWIDDEFVRDPTSSRTVTSNRVLGGFSFGPRAVLNGTVLVGIRQFPDGKGVPAYKGPAFSIRTRVPFPRLFIINATADRDVYYAIEQVTTTQGRSRNTYTSMRYRGEISAGLPLGLIGRVGIGQEKARFVLPYLRSGVEAHREDRLLTISSSLLHQFGRSLRVGAALTWGRRQSTLSDVNYTGMRYGVQAELAP